MDRGGRYGAAKALAAAYADATPMPVTPRPTACTRGAGGASPKTAMCRHTRARVATSPQSLRTKVSHFSRSRVQHRRAPEDGDPIDIQLEQRRNAARRRRTMAGAALSCGGSRDVIDYETLEGQNQELKLALRKAGEESKLLRVHGLRLESELLHADAKVDMLLSELQRAPDSSRNQRFVDAARCEVQKCAVVRKLSKQKEVLRKLLLQRDKEIETLRRTQESSAVAEMTAAAEEYLMEILRLQKVNGPHGTRHYDAHSLAPEETGDGSADSETVDTGQGLRDGPTFARDRRGRRRVGYAARAQDEMCLCWPPSCGVDDALISGSPLTEPDAMIARLQQRQYRKYHQTNSANADGRSLTSLEQRQRPRRSAERHFSHAPRTPSDVSHARAWENGSSRRPQSPVRRVRSPPHRPQMSARATRGTFASTRGDLIRALAERQGAPLDWSHSYAVSDARQGGIEAVRQAVAPGGRPRRNSRRDRPVSAPSRRRETIKQGTGNSPSWGGQPVSSDPCYRSRLAVRARRPRSANSSYDYPTKWNARSGAFEHIKRPAQNRGKTGGRTGDSTERSRRDGNVKFLSVADLFASAVSQVEGEELAPDSATGQPTTTAPTSRDIGAAHAEHQRQTLRWGEDSTALALDTCQALRDQLDEVLHCPRDEVSTPEKVIDGHPRRHRDGRDDPTSEYQRRVGEQRRYGDLEAKALHAKDAPHAKRGGQNGDSLHEKGEDADGARIEPESTALDTSTNGLPANARESTERCTFHIESTDSPEVRSHDRDPCTEVVTNTPRSDAGRERNLRAGGGEFAHAQDDTSSASKDSLARESSTDGCTHACNDTNMTQKESEKVAATESRREQVLALHPPHADCEKGDRAESVGEVVDDDSNRITFAETSAPHVAGGSCARDDLSRHASHEGSRQKATRIEHVETRSCQRACGASCGASEGGMIDRAMDRSGGRDLDAPSDGRSIGCPGPQHHAIEGEECTSLVAIEDSGVADEEIDGAHPSDDEFRQSRPIHDGHVTVVESVGVEPTSDNTEATTISASKLAPEPTHRNMTSECGSDPLADGNHRRHGSESVVPEREGSNFDVSVDELGLPSEYGDDFDDED